MSILTARHVVVAACAASALAFTSMARASSVDGTLDPAYGAPLVVQTTQTTQKGYPYGQVDYSVSSELDAAYGYADATTLHLFFAGNLAFWWGIEGTTEWEPMDIFIDTGAGGQNTLLANNPTIDGSYDMKVLAGLKFDPGFAPGYWFSIGGDPPTGWPRWSAFMANLPPGGGGVGTLLGTTLSAGDGTLTGGTNPFGIEVAVNDSNTAGVTLGCGAASGAGVKTGVEWAIPLAAIGNPAGCIRVCAYVARPDHGLIFNQVLGPLPPGTCDLGAPAGVDFAAIAGDQFFSVCSAATPTRRASWGSIKTIYR